MILSELSKCYDRLRTQEDSGVPPLRWTKEHVFYRLLIDRDGRLVEAVPCVSGEGKSEHRFIDCVVPEHGGRSGAGLNPLFLCDNGAYLLALDAKRGAKKFQAARALHERVLHDVDSPAARAVLRYFERGPQSDLISEEIAADLAKSFAAFVLYPDSTWIHEDPAVATAWEADCARPVEDDDHIIGQCSITGRQAPIARLFPQITGFAGAQSAGAALVSFNKDSFESYGKSQAYNASISEDVARKAGSALRYLVKERSHRSFIGSTAFLFWADRHAPREDELMAVIVDAMGATSQEASSDERGEDTGSVHAVHNVVDALRRGIPVGDYDIESRYYLLGLAPNLARLSVRFFRTDTFGSIMLSYGQYLDDIAMAGVKTTSFRQLLLQTAALGDGKNIPSTLLSSSFEAMISGRRFPPALMTAVLSRMRSDHASRNSWDMGERAALLKACLVRNERKRGVVPNIEREITMSLNRENVRIGYVLGRLFAFIERAQELSSGGNLNATVKDKYIGAAASTPARVFPLLIKNGENHLAKLRKTIPGMAVILQKEIGAVIDQLDGSVGVFPTTLDPEEQGSFYIGYYQQRTEFFKKKQHSEQVDPGEEAEIDEAEA